MLDSGAKRVSLARAGSLFALGFAIGLALGGYRVIDRLKGAKLYPKCRQCGARMPDRMPNGKLRKICDDCHAACRASPAAPDDWPTDE